MAVMAASTGNVDTLQAWNTYLSVCLALLAVPSWHALVLKKQLSLLSTQVAADGNLTPCSTLYMACNLTNVKGK